MWRANSSGGRSPSSQPLLARTGSRRAALGLLATLLLLQAACDDQALPFEPALSTPLIAFVESAPAQVETVIVPGDGWHLFTVAGAGSFAEEGPFTYSSELVTRVTVTDVGCIGDEFRVHDGESPLGETSPVETGACPDPDDITTPDAAFADGRYSSGVFFLAPGSHAINIEVTEDPFTSGFAWLRIDEASIALDDCQDGGWQDLGGVFKNQGACVSYVAKQRGNGPGGP
jgi:hypothetical protein